MNALFEKLKQKVEEDLGRSLEQPEEIELKGLYYFGKGVKLKNQLESDVEARTQQGKNQHRRRVISAVKDFMSSQQTQSKTRSK